MKRTEDFRFTDISWHEISKKVLPPSLAVEHLLNQNLKIKAYGEILDWLCLVHIVASETIHKPYKRYSRKYKNLYIQYKLDYQQFVQANDQEALEIMALSFLDVIKQFPKWKIKDFDWQRLYSDAQKLFLEHHFIRENGEKG